MLMCSTEVGDCCMRMVPLMGSCCMSIILKGPCVSMASLPKYGFLMSRGMRTLSLRQNSCGMHWVSPNQSNTWASGTPNLHLPQAIDTNLTCSLTTITNSFCKYSQCTHTHSRGHTRNLANATEQHQPHPEYKQHLSESHQVQGSTVSGDT
jgi:hypothetical protein